VLYAAMFKRSRKVYLWRRLERTRPTSSPWCH